MKARNLELSIFAERGHTNLGRCDEATVKHSLISPVEPEVQIPRHVGPPFHVMPGRDSTACRATVPR